MKEINLKNCKFQQAIPVSHLEKEYNTFNKLHDFIDIIVCSTMGELCTKMKSFKFGKERINN